MVAILLSLAVAGTLDGWAGTRWHVQVEETLPMQLPIAGPDQNPPVMRAFQIEVVLSCPTATPSGKSAIFLSCKPEALALRGTPQADPGKRLDEYKAALDGLATAMRSGSYEIKLKDDGRVASVDYTEPPKTNAVTTEAARALAIDLLNGFSLQRSEIPAAKWDETNSPLIRAAAQPMGTGRTKVQHTAVTQEGQSVIESAGEGTFTSQYLSWASGRIDGAGAPASSVAAIASQSQTGVVGEERTFDASFYAATLDDPSGLFHERVWKLTATPKPGANDITGVQGTPLWTAGRIVRLDASARPELGATGLCGAPGADFGLSPWTPLPIGL